MIWGGIGGRIPALHPGTCSKRCRHCPPPSTTNHTHTHSAAPSAADAHLQRQGFELGQRAPLQAAHAMGVQRDAAQGGAGRQAGAEGLDVHHLEAGAAQLQVGKGAAAPQAQPLEAGGLQVK